MTAEEMITKKGIDRRDLIKKGAAAGAVFWAVPVIESITSKAAAASGCVTFNASWVYVVYTYNGTTYFTGFSASDSTGSCTPGSNPSSHGTFTVGPCNGVYYKITNFTGAPSDGSILYGTSSPPTNPATYEGSPNCNTYVTLHGGEVTPVLNGVTIVAAFCFGAGSLGGTCASSNSTCANCG